ncbi:hypothetical protein ACVJGD_008192 [Bradyrhizobium sp. USDA 10063]
MCPDAITPPRNEGEVWQSEYSKYVPYLIAHNQKKARWTIWKLAWRRWKHDETRCLRFRSVAPLRSGPERGDGTTRSVPGDVPDSRESADHHEGGHSD